MESLPAELTIDILLRLPVKTIIDCKCVCKKWRNLVSDSSFVDLHLSKSPTGLLVRQYVNFQTHCHPGILKWVDIEDKDDHHHLHHVSLDLNTIPIFQNTPIIQMGSVNGLICLYDHSPENNTYICNPVTGEIMIIPVPQHDNVTVVAYGFGVCSLTGEYKVVRAFERELPSMNVNPSYRVSVLEAEVYTLGTGQWRSLGRLPYKLNRYDAGTVLNDHFHWIVSDAEDASETICTFDLNNETFQLFPSPPPSTEDTEDTGYDYESLAVLKGCLCKSDGNDSQFTIWVMKEYALQPNGHLVTEEKRQ